MLNANNDPDITCGGQFPALFLFICHTTLKLIYLFIYFNHNTHTTVNEHASLLSVLCSMHRGL